MRGKVLALYLLLCLIWGTTWLAIKVSLNAGLPPFFSAGIRFLLAGAVLWLLLVFRREPIPTSPVALRLYLLYGLVNFTLSYGITYWATQYVYSNVSSLVWAGYPVMVSLLAHWMLESERLTPAKLGSILLGTVGVVLIITQSGTLGGSHVTAGILLLTVAVIMASLPAVYLKKHHQAVNTLQLNTVTQTMAGVLLLIISVLVEFPAALPLTATTLIATGYLALFGSVVSWLIYFWLFSHLSVVQIAYIALFPPLIATGLGWILLDEKLTPLMLLGGLLVILGGTGVNRAGNGL